MLENFAFASYKKVKDVAATLVRRFYGRASSHFYCFGGSEGGREGLAMAQRFPADYNGIVSVVPVICWTGLFHAFVRNSLPQFGDWLDAPKTAFIAKATTDACDALDGLVDGVVNNYLACQARVNLQPLRCPDGGDGRPHCLSDAELALMRSVHSRYLFTFPLAHGLTSYPQWLYGSNWIRYAIARNASFDVQTYRPEFFAARVQQTSALMDATNPDLSAFFARGGKLILRENAADRAQSPLMGIEYHHAVASRLGLAAVDRSMRL